MSELQALRAEHESALHAFEVENRAYFAHFVSDRGDEFFEQFHRGFCDLLEAQALGVDRYHVVVEPDGTVLGRFNLLDLRDGTAVLGYRVAERASGQGLASQTVRELCEVAPVCFGLRELRAATSLENVASQRVLVKAGFREVGAASPEDVGGRRGRWYRRELGAA